MNFSDTINSSANISHKCIPSTTITKQILPLAYGLIFIGGILLNGPAAWIFFHISSNRSFVVYLKNIIIADLLMTFTFPFKFVNDLDNGPWQMRVVVCRFSAVIFYLNMYIGIIFLGLISFDRYYKIVKPFLASFFQSVTCSKIFSGGIWAIMMILLIPNMILTNRTPTEEHSRNCTGLKSELGIQWHKVSNYISVGIFWIVFSLLIFFYSSISRKIYNSYRKFRKKTNSAKKKSSRNIFSIMLVFCICFVPYHICRIPYTASQTGSTFSCQSKITFYYLKEFTLLLSSANVCLDPVIYFLLCQPFRRMLFKKLFARCGNMNATEMYKSRRSPTPQGSVCSS
ncbi:P2Y purinoceptor 14 isoform X2 [Rhinatrema bivittatum]|nr:P2Y purinoceptor 14 isoform X2 [Rhinatrema bivittatum]XP_029471899.1 P2Y purinoceptor 14 isoform X2 [Rhinatrema bivittatum]XP_029471900.1 P2Y purinoceptor 14 isoform X2 [Rhinatrema bivittatum]